jgi:short-subunit dehydrogenase
MSRDTKGFALITGASSGIGAIYASHQPAVLPCNSDMQQRR